MEQVGDKSSGNPHTSPWRSILGNTNPHHTGLWWLTRLNTRESWNIWGCLDSYSLWRTDMLCQSHRDPIQTQQFERFISNGKSASGVVVGESSFCWKKGSWMMLCQPSLSLIVQRAHKNQLQMLHLPCWWLGPMVHFPTYPPTCPTCSAQQGSDFVAWHVEGIFAAWQMEVGFPSLPGPLSPAGEAPAGTRCKCTISLVGSPAPCHATLNTHLTCPASATVPPSLPGRQRMATPLMIQQKQECSAHKRLAEESCQLWLAEINHT